jgi:phosphoglycolate phosphatase
MSVFGHVEQVVWDWNGTLLDDLEHSVAVMNELLGREGLEPLSVERYRRLFDFPVRRYYERLGFDLSGGHWDRLAAEFIRGYDRGVRGCRLHPGAGELLHELGARGVRSSILTAARRASVEALLDHHGARALVGEVVGLDDHYASGKESIARAWQEQTAIDRRTTVLVGDTLHDAEVAAVLGIRCILVSVGHHGRSRLAESGHAVVGSFAELGALLLPSGIRA